MKTSFAIRLVLPRSHGVRGRTHHASHLERYGRVDNRAVIRGQSVLSALSGMPTVKRTSPSNDSAKQKKCRLRCSEFNALERGHYMARAICQAGVRMFP